MWDSDGHSGDHPNTFQVMPSQGLFLYGWDQVDPLHHWKDEGMSSVLQEGDSIYQDTREGLPVGWAAGDEAFLSGVGNPQPRSSSCL